MIGRPNQPVIDIIGNTGAREFAKTRLGIKRLRTIKKRKKNFRLIREFRKSSCVSLAFNFKTSHIHAVYFTSQSFHIFTEKKYQENLT